MKKRLLAFLLIFSFVLTLAPSVMAARIPQGQNGKTIWIAQMDENGGKEREPLFINDNTIGIRFKTDKMLQNVAVVSPTYGDTDVTATLTLYKWNNNYKTTISTKPIATKTYEDYSDGTSLKVSPPLGQVVTGEFLVTVSNGKYRAGVWKSKPGATIKSDVEFYECYLNGNVTDYSVRASCMVAEMPAAVEEKEATVKDAYSRLMVTDNDFLSSGLWLSERDDGYGTGEKAPYVGGAQTGSYIVFRNVDFGKTSPKGIRMRIFNQGVYSNVGETQVVLDSIYGYPIAKTTVVLEEPERSWETTTCEITEKVTGVHDVYFIMRGSEFAPSWYEFTKDVPELSKTDLRLKEFLDTPSGEYVERYEDTWAGSDMLGRKLPDNNDVGDPKENRQTAIFYHNWRSVFSRTNEPVFDVTRILNSYEGDPLDIRNDVNYPYWGKAGKAHFWNESVYGYYTGYDNWVIRKHLELFAAADIDGVVFDNTNQNLTFTQGWLHMGKLIHEMRCQGIDVPGMSFMTPFGANQNTVDDIRIYYDNMYSTGLYSDAWFYWDGKPLIMGFPDLFRVDTEYDDINAQNKEILDFFTFRPVQGNYWYGPSRDDMWPWLEVYPQHSFVRDADGSFECIAVGTAQNTNNEDKKGTYGAFNQDGAFGRSYTKTNGHTLLDENSCYYGYNFQEQWDYAISQKPQIIFITGWNEGIAGRYKEKEGIEGSFFDGYNNEYSRDIEPIKSDFKDNYYMQMVKNIRRYKGVQKTPEAGEKVTIDINGSFSQWDNVALTYYDYTGLPTRNDVKMGQLEKYVNESGRNDFAYAKAARDSDNIYFYVETVDDISPYTDNAWMRLFINPDRMYASGWEGYDYALNITPATADKLTLSKSVGFWEWEDVATVDYKVEGNKMMVTVPKALIGLNGVRNIDMEFKWADNMQTQGNLMQDFYTNGDVAPKGRFNYRFVENAKNTSTKAIEEFVLPEPNVFDKVRNFTILKIDTPFALTDDGAVPIDSTNSAVTPIVQNDRTFVPVRFVTEKLYAHKIEWDDATKTATIHYYQLLVKITEGSNEIVVENTIDGSTHKVKMDVSAFTMNDRMYVPLRAVSEAFGNVQIHWEDPCYVYIGNKYTDDYKDDPEIKWLMAKYFN